VKKTNRCLVVHEDHENGRAIAGEHAAILWNAPAPGWPMMRSHGPRYAGAVCATLEEYFVPNKEKVVHAARGVARY